MSLPPFTLSLLGAPRLRGPHGALPAPAPRVAALAALTVAGTAGLDRDALARLLWPGADAARARRDVERLLESLRQDAGTTLVTGGDSLAIDRALVRTDLDAFDTAVALGRHDDALAAYAGPFLDGFVLEQAPTFAHWQREERTRRARQALEAAEALVAELEGTGRDATIERERADELRAAMATPELLAAPTQTRPRRRWPWLVGAGAVVALAGSTAFHPSVPFTGGKYIVVGEFANLTGDTLLSRVARTAFTRALAQSSWVTPLPRPRVQSALRRMRRDDTTSLASLALAREVAVREHAPLVVTGDLARTEGGFTVATRIVDAATGEVLRERTERAASRDAILGAIGELAATLRRDLGEARSSVRAAVPLPAFTTSSLEALRHVAEGDRVADDQNDPEAAARHYEAAIALDSSFARARASYGNYLVFNNRPADAEPHLAAAERLAATLPPAEALPVLATVQRARGDHAAAARSWKTYLAQYPQDAEGWRSYASELRRLDDVRGALAAYDSAARRMPLNSGDRLELAAMWMGEMIDARDATRAVAAADSARTEYERAFALDSTLLTYLYVNHQYGATLVRTGKPDSARVVYARMLRRDANDRARGMRSLGYLEAWEGRWRSASRWFADAARTSAGEQQWTSAARSAALAGAVLALAGDTAAARIPLRQAASWASAHDVETRIARFAAVGLALAGDAPTLDRYAAWMRGALLPTFKPGVTAMSQVAAASLLAHGRATAARDTMAVVIAADSGSYPRALLAMAQDAAGDHAGAAASWRRLRGAFAYGDEEQFLVQLAPYREGRAREAAGDAAGAREAYEAFVASFPPVTPAAELPAAVADARGRLERLAR